MASEGLRGCGYRRVGGTYLCGEYIPMPCDRLPLPLEVCPICGQGIKVSRAFTKINPFRLWGNHDETVTVFEDNPEVKGDIIKHNCFDAIRPCHVCDPKDETAFIMRVGERYYPKPEDFIKEAHRMGVSKKIPFVPKEMELGKTVVYLAHPKAVENQVEPENSDTVKPKLLEVQYTMGIFMAFVPQRVERLVWESKLDDKLREKLEKQNITPVSITDGDIDHL